MAITVIQRPDRFAPVYGDATPTKYKFTSNLSPAVGEFSKVINIIRAPNTFETDTLGWRPDKAVVNTLEPIEGIEEGCFVDIKTTDEQLYSGIFRVLKLLPSNNSTFQIDTTFIGDDSSGFAAKFFKDYSIIVRVFVNGTLRIEKTKARNFDNEFVFDLARDLQPFVGSDLEELDSIGQPTALNTAVPFYIEYTDGWTRRNSAGFDVFQENTFIDDSLNTFNAVNAVTDQLELIDNVLVNPTGDLDDFETTASTTDARFLTNQPDTVRIGPDQHYQLAHLVSPADNQFPDADSGTMEANITGLSAGAAGTNLVQSNDIAFQGNFSARVEVQDPGIVVLPTTLITSTAFALPEGDYTVRCRLAFLSLPAFSPVGDNFIQLDTNTGFTGGVTVVNNWDLATDINPSTWYTLESTFSVPGGGEVGSLALDIQIFGFPAFAGAEFYVDNWEIFPTEVDLVRRVETFDSAGASLATDDVAFSASSDRGVTHLIGTSNLGGLITPSVASYTVQILNDSLAAVSELKTFELDETCTRTAFEIEWVNTKGGLDSWIFKGNTENTLEVTENRYKRVLSDEPSFDERQITTNYLVATDFFTANTNYITREQANWIRELLISPEAYIVVLDKDDVRRRIPIHITKESFAITNSIDRTYNLSFSWQVAREFTTQRN